MGEAFKLARNKEFVLITVDSFLLGEDFRCTSALGTLLVLAVVFVDWMTPQIYFLYFRGGGKAPPRIFSLPLSSLSTLSLSFVLVRRTRHFNPGRQERQVVPSRRSPVIRHLITNLNDKLDRRPTRGTPPLCPVRLNCFQVYVVYRIFQHLRHFFVFLCLCFHTKINYLNFCDVVFFYLFDLRWLLLLLQYCVLAA